MISDLTLNASSGESVDGALAVERNARELDIGHPSEIRMKRQASLLQPGQPVTVHVFLDRSIIEVYVNGMAYTARVFAETVGLDTCHS